MERINLMYDQTENEEAKSKRSFTELTNAINNDSNYSMILVFASKNCTGRSVNQRVISTVVIDKVQVLGVQDRILTSLKCVLNV